MTQNYCSNSVPFVLWIVKCLLKSITRNKLKINMEILHSNVGTTKPWKYIFMEFKFNDIFVVFHNEKILVQVLNICVFKVGLLKWFMEIWKKMLGLINNSKMHLQDALLIDLYLIMSAHFVINANNSCIFVHLTKYFFLWMERFHLSLWLTLCVKLN